MNERNTLIIFGISLLAGFVILRIGFFKKPGVIKPPLKANKAAMADMENALIGLKAAKHANYDGHLISELPSMSDDMYRNFGLLMAVDNKGNLIIKDRTGKIIAKDQII